METYKVFIFDPDARHRFLSALLGWLADEPQPGFAVMVNYDRGPQVEVAGERTSDELARFVDAHLAQLRAAPDRSVDYEAQRRLVDRVALLEGRSEAGAELATDLTVEHLSGDLNRVMFPANFIDDYRNLTGFLSRFLPYYLGVDRSVRSLLLLKLMMIFPEPRWGEPGVYSAYYSFASHLHGFSTYMERLPWAEDQLQTIKARVRSRTQAEEVFVDQGFARFLDCLDGGFASAESDAERAIFLDFQRTAAATREEYAALFDREEIGLTDRNGVASFLESNPDLSDFHLQVKGTIDPGFFDSREFVVGRMMMNWFYSMLPYLLVSPIEKQRLCRLLVDAVERHRGASSAELLEQLAAKAVATGTASDDGA